MLRPKSLTLRELEALARALLAVLLAFLHARIARQESVFPQCRPQFGVEPRDRAGESHANGPCLSASAAAVRRDHHIDLVSKIGEFQRLGGVVLPSEIGEVLLYRPAVDRKFARAWPNEYARHGFFPAAGTLEPGF